MVKYSKGTRQPINEEDLQGLFADERVGKTMKFGQNDKGRRWVSLRNAEGEASIFSLSKRVNDAVTKQLEGVEDKQTRIDIFNALINGCNILEVPDRYEPAEGQSEGKQKYEDDGVTPKMRWILVAQGGEGITEAQVNASVAKAATFSIKSAMTNRI